MDEAKIKLRIQARELLSLADGEESVAFWEAIRDEAEKHLPKPAEPPSLEPMTDDEAFKFESTVMPWGKYDGKPVSVVPLWYLESISARPDEFKRDVVRYLKSNRVQLERECDDYEE